MVVDGDDELPALMDVSVTSGHMEQELVVQRQLIVGAGFGIRTVSTKPQKKALLCDAVAGLIMMMANGVVEWPCLMSSRLIALDKNPGVHPIGGAS